MVILDKNHTSAHNIALRHQGRPVLTHNQISRHPSFRNRVTMGSNFDTNGGVRHNLASFIHGKFALHGVPYDATTKRLLRNMVNTIIRLREENQAKFVQSHLGMMGQYQVRRDELNREHARVRNMIANQEPAFRQLLERISANPTNENLVRQRNARLQRDPQIRRINVMRARIARRVRRKTDKVSQHSRQIAAWRWVRDRILSTVNHVGPRNR